MRRPSLIVVALLTLCGAPSLAQLKDSPGSFRMQGTNPDGSRYRGDFSLGRSATGDLVATWVLSSGERISGPAVQEGGVLSVAYSLGGRVGVAAYVTQPDGSLRGTWTTGRGLGTEVLTPR